MSNAKVDGNTSDLNDMHSCLACCPLKISCLPSLTITNQDYSFFRLPVMFCLLECNCLHEFMETFGKKSLKILSARYLVSSFATSFQSQNIQPWPLAYKWLLNKPYENEVTLTRQNQALKCCHALET